MADYKEKISTVREWIRACQATIFIPYNQTPRLEVVEEKAMEVDGNVTRSLLPPLYANFNSSESFQLRNPITDELIGTTATHGDIQVLMYSLIRSMQLARDAAVPAVEPESP